MKKYLPNEEVGLLKAIGDSMWHQHNILADYYDEQGKPYLAMAWRWIADNRRFPRCYPNGRWTWHFWGSSPSPSPFKPLPKPADLLLERLPCLKPRPVHKTLEEAFVCAAKLMAEWFEQQEKSNA